MMCTEGWVDSIAHAATALDDVFPPSLTESFIKRPESTRANITLPACMRAYSVGDVV